MTAPEMFTVLVQRTPYLLGGYGYNLLIAALAMVVGTVAGCMAGMARHSRHRLFRMAGRLFSSVCRNVPSFVLMFYVAFVLPVEFQWGDTLLRVPLWVKATLALVIPVIGFASDQSLAYLRQRQQGKPDTGAVFLVGWIQYFLIVLMASSTASVIGADEVVGRANRVIAIDNSPEFLLLVYGYVCLWFLLTGQAISRGIQVLQRLAYRRS